MKMMNMVCFLLALGLIVGHFKSTNDMRSLFPRGINQNDCGSCWAMSTSQFLSAWYTLQKRQVYHQEFDPPQFSPDFFIDCDREDSPIDWVVKKNVPNHGCDGGKPGLAIIFSMFNIMEHIPIPTMSEYEEALGMFSHSVKKMNARCNKYLQNLGVIPEYQGYLLGYRAKLATLKTNDELRTLIDAYGPVVVAVSLDPRIITLLSQMFKKDDEIFYGEKDCKPPEKIDHAVVIAGYMEKMIKGVKKNVWIIRNSWENKKNPNNFIYIDADKDNICGVLQQITYLAPK